MTPAYDETYLRPARASLARAFDYAVHDEQTDLDRFCSLFVSSGVARRFERGDARTIAGQSGVELAREVLSTASGYEPTAARYAQDRSPEYWAGWSLAHYQWQTALPFERIFAAVPVDGIVLMYGKYHEMDVAHFTERMNERLHEAESTPRLKAFRLRAGMSQREVAERSGVPLRSVQQYEQRQKSINRASFDTVVALAKAVYCSDPTELMEVD